MRGMKDRTEESITNTAGQHVPAYGGLIMLIRNAALFLACAAMLVLPAATLSFGAKADFPPELKKMMKEKQEALDRKGGRVKHTGKNFRNKRFDIPQKPGTEVVDGMITGIDRGGIYMDGEFFGLGLVELVDDAGRDLFLADLYVGLGARIVLSYGNIRKAIIHGLVIREPITDPVLIKSIIEPELPEGAPEGGPEGFPEGLGR